MPSIVLVHPEIPHNTGAIGRTCVALDLELILIRPLGFILSDKYLRRAGLDYWQHLHLSEFASWEAFLAARKPSADQLFLFEEDAPRTFFEPDYTDDAYLVFGSETKGLPLSIREVNRQREFALPMRSDKIRSLNLANSVTAVAYQALRGTF